MMILPISYPLSSKISSAILPNPLTYTVSPLTLLLAVTAAPKKISISNIPFSDHDHLSFLFTPFNISNPTILQHHQDLKSTLLVSLGFLPHDIFSCLLAKEIIIITIPNSFFALVNFPGEIIILIKVNQTTTQCLHSCILICLMFGR